MYDILLFLILKTSSKIFQASAGQAAGRVHRLWIQTPSPRGGFAQEGLVPQYPHGGLPLCGVAPGPSLNDAKSI